MLSVGVQLSGRYRIEDVLGQGGMGAVYLATMESLGNKKVAVKEMELPSTLDRDSQQAVAQFRREATFLAHLDHPNLVKVTDFFSEGEKHYLVMDYVDGETLQEKLQKRNKPFSWQELKPVARDLVKVLSYLHTRTPPILFRDLKPANIMIDSRGRVKLIDFGIARTANPGLQTSTFLKGTGTNGFSPIEQYGAGETTDQTSDIYAFGATLYYLLTGKLPPSAVSRVSLGTALVPADQLNPNLPLGMEKALARCLEVRQDKRPESMREVAKMFGRLSSRAATAEQRRRQFELEHGVHIHAHQSSGRGAWAAALAVLGVACVATVSLFVQNVGEQVRGEASAAQELVSKKAPVSRVYAPAPRAAEPVRPAVFSDTPVAETELSPHLKSLTAEEWRQLKERGYVERVVRKRVEKPILSVEKTPSSAARKKFSLGELDYPTYQPRKQAPKSPHEGLKREHLKLRNRATGGLPPRYIF